MEKMTQQICIKLIRSVCGVHCSATYVRGWSFVNCDTIISISKVENYGRDFN